MRITQAYIARLEPSLTVPERLIIKQLSFVRYASAKQLERLFFYFEGSAYTRERRCQRTLRHLVELGVLGRLDDRPIGPRGSKSFIYTLGVAGQRLVGDGGPAGGARFRTPWMPTEDHLRHALDVTELHVRLVELERTAAGLEVLEFMAEPACWRSYSSPYGVRLWLKPDAYARLRLGPWVDRWFIEVYRFDQSRLNLRAKLDSYRHYWQSGRWEASGGVCPGVLLLATHKARPAALVAAVAAQPESARVLFQVGRYSEVGAILTTAPEPLAA
jgi:hypothetical protein